MILSILIPVYNYGCLRLVKNLCRQAENCGLEYEIIVADDGSTDAESLGENRTIGSLPHARFCELGENHGRAWIRNWLTRQACGQSLLYIDSDAQVCNPDFLKNYRPFMGTEKVVCGGIIHPDRLPSPDVSLRYNYEKKMEPHFVAAERTKHPYANLRTFNFMMPRDVALSHPFDESITLYGYEDTMLGGWLQADKVPVVHIDNPLINGDIETNARFLAKTEESMHSLYNLRREMADHSRLLSHYRSLERFRLVGMAKCLFSLFRPLLRRQLLGTHPSVLLLQLYKLGYYCTLNK